MKTPIVRSTTLARPKWSPSRAWHQSAETSTECNSGHSDARRSESWQTAARLLLGGAPAQRHGTAPGGAQARLLL
eukprot:7777361-Pyramimonas_sp.AAC.1